MSEPKSKTEKMTLNYHLAKLNAGERCFENVFETVSRMFLSESIEDIVVNGSAVHDYMFFRRGEKHIIAMYDVLNKIVSYTRDAAQGGSSKEMALVLVGEPGNGKTFTIQYIMDHYRKFLALPGNRKFTFRFVNLDKVGGYGKFKTVRSQIYEDPVILAMNMVKGADKESEENRKWLSDQIGLNKNVIKNIYRNYRPLGACSAYIWRDIREYTGGKIEEMLKFIKVESVPLEPGLGTITGKYPAKDKITSSAEDLVGSQQLIRELQIDDPENPYRYNLQAGALARVAGGGIHFADEIFKNKKDLVQVYLGVIQNRSIELEGYTWPIDTLILATSNNAEFFRFQSEKEESPILDRCRIVWVGHNTDYILQKQLTEYAIGSETRTVIEGDNLHQDPNTEFAYSAFCTLTRLPHDKKLTPIETMQLAAGEIAGEKSIKTLAEVIDEKNENPNPSMRFAQKGLGQRDLGRMIQLHLELHDTQEYKCLHALDVFEVGKIVIRDSVTDQNDREKYKADLKTAKTLYRERIMTEMFNAYMESASAIKKDVMSYVNMIIGIDAENLGPEKMWKFKDPVTGKRKVIKIDETFIDSVEERLGLKSSDEKDNYRTKIRKLYGQKLTNDPKYDFMDERDLLKAVTDVRLKSDIAGAGSLIGALANRTNEENQKLYDRMIKTMTKKLKYCQTCAWKTIEYFCTSEDES